MDDHVVREIEARIAAAGAGTVAVASCDLAGGDTILVRADEPFHPASTMKVCVLMEVWRQAAARMLSLDDPLVVRNAFRSLVEGREYSLDPAGPFRARAVRARGGTATIRELARLMITVSSNLATNLLIDRVGAAAVTSFMRQGAPSLVVLRGLEDDAAHDLGLDNAATARGLMHVLRRLARGEVVSAAASGEMLDVLTGQAFNEGIPAGLPPGTRVAHKTGSFDGVYHDAGVVYPPAGDPYVLVVLTRGIAEERRALALVAGISRLIWDVRGERHSTDPGVPPQGL